MSCSEREWLCVIIVILSVSYVGRTLQFLVRVNSFLSVRSLPIGRRKKAVSNGQRMHLIASSAIFGNRYQFSFDIDVIISDKFSLTQFNNCQLRVSGNNSKTISKTNSAFSRVDEMIR